MMPHLSQATSVLRPFVLAIAIIIFAPFFVGDKQSAYPPVNVLTMVVVPQPPLPANVTIVYKS
jgi:hypothetical protein